MKRGDTELASVMRKIIAASSKDGYINWGATDWEGTPAPWVTVDTRQIPITEEEMQIIAEVAL